MIRGVHTLFYSSQPDELRAFLRDKLCFTSFTGVGGGWLIFGLPEADMGVHSVDAEDGAPSGTPHISFYCDDVHKTVAEFEGPRRRVRRRRSRRELGTCDVLPQAGQFRRATVPAQVRQTGELKSTHGEFRNCQSG